MFPVQIPLSGAVMPTAETFNVSIIPQIVNSTYKCLTGVFTNFTADSGGPILSDATLSNTGMYAKSLTCYWTYCAASPAYQIR